MRSAGFISVILLFVFARSLSYAFADDLEKKLQEWRESRIAETKDGWYFSFEKDDDSNRFPDDWSRSKNYKLADGRTLAYASWAEIRLDNKVKKAGRNSLFIHSEGEQPISIETDNFKINYFTAYELNGWFNLDTESCQRTHVTLGVLWYDQEHQLLPSRTEDSFSIGFTDGWEFKTQRINIVDNRATFARLYIKADGDDKDAKIWIDEIKFSKRPMIQMVTNKFLNTYHENEPFEFHVKIRGLEKNNYKLEVDMLDVHNAQVFSEAHDITIAKGEVVEQKEFDITIKAKEKGSFFDNDRSERNRLIKGIFQINAVLKEGAEEIAGNNIRVARTTIAKRGRIKDDGEIFGVTVNDIDASYNLKQGLELASLLRVKLPVWSSDLEWDGQQFKQNQTRKYFSDLVKEIKSGDNQPEIVGVFAPRPKVLSDLADPGLENLVLADEKLWRPFFESSIYNLRSNIKTWQLGDDDDASFSNDEKQKKALEVLSPYLEKAGQVGSVTRILKDSYNAEKQLQANRLLMFYNFEYTDDFNFEAFHKIIPKEEEQFIVKKWLTIPLKSRLSFQNDFHIAVDLFKKIVWARKNDVKRIFISCYQDEFVGLINHRNELTPAFLATKLSAEQLSEVSYMGSLPEFGEDIQNFVFSLNQNPKKAIVVAWSKRSDDPQKKFDFTEGTLIQMGKTLNDLIVTLNQPDINLNFKIEEFFTNLNAEVSKAHISKGLNNIINVVNIRKAFLQKYNSMRNLSKSPSLRSLLLKKGKSEEEEKECARMILEENYPQVLYPINQIKKNILLDQEVERLDLMGNVTPITVKWQDGDPYQEILVDQYPTIFTGLSRDFIKTRISIHLDSNAPLYSRLEKQKQTIIIQNYYDQPMEGIFTINYPPAWKNFNPFVKFRLEKGEKKSYDFYIIPSRIASPGQIHIGLRTTFTTDRKYSFRSEREANLISDLIIGAPGEKLAIVPPKFGDDQERHILNIPISLRPNMPNRPDEVDLVVTVDLPDGDSLQTRVDKVQVGTFRVANFSIKLKKEFNNKRAKIKIEQRGSSSESLIFHNFDLPIPDTE